MSPITMKNSRAFWAASPLIFLAIIALFAVYSWGYDRGIKASPHDRAMYILHELYPGQDAY